MEPVVISDTAYDRWLRLARIRNQSRDACVKIFWQATEVHAGPNESRRFVHAKRCLTFVVDAVPLLESTGEVLVIKTIIPASMTDLGHVRSEKEKARLRVAAAMKGGL